MARAPFGLLKGSLYKNVLPPVPDPEGLGALVQLLVQVVVKVRDVVRDDLDTIVVGFADSQAAVIAKAGDEAQRVGGFVDGDHG